MKSVNGRWLRLSQKRILFRKDEYGTPTEVGRLNGPVWFVRRDEQYEREKEYRRLQDDRSAKLTVAAYKLTVAVVHSNHRDSEIAFSDGICRTMRREAGVYVLPAEIPVRTSTSSVEANLEASYALPEMISLLYVTEYGSLAASFIAEVLKERYSRAVVSIAMNAAMWWNLIQSDSQESKRTIWLTDSGILWHEATVEFQRNLGPSIGRVRPMGNRSNRSEQPHIVVHGANNIVNVAGRDVRSSVHSRQDHREPIDPNAIVSALRALLTESEIPWQTPTMSSARETIERAVSTSDVQEPAVKRAISTVFSVSSNLGLSIAANALYDILKHFISG